MRSFVGAIRELGVEPDRLDDVFDALDYGVFVDHVEKGCIYANKAILEMFGIDWEAFAGFGWAHAVVPEDMEHLRSAIERYEKEKTWIRVGYRIKVPDGSIRHLRVVGRALLDDEGRQLGSFILGRNVTKERLLEERSTQTQKLEAIGRLAGRVAHDFNNVLTPILFSAAMLEEEQLSKEGSSLLGTIQQSVDHAVAITRQLLGLSRQRVHERSTSNLDVELVGLRTLLNQLLGETIELRLELTAQGRFVALAPHEIGQIVLNLCVNARDAMSGTGCIAIRTLVSGDDVQLIVEDDGPGISVDVQRRMFEPFFTTKKEGRGTGLGLATVRDLARNAAGKVDVHSELGRGTRVTLTLPSTTAATWTKTAADVSLDVPTKRILLVDDDSALRQTLAYVLALRRHVVKTSASRRRALMMLEQEEFDVLITDVLLADGNGAELVATAREARPNLHVVYMSGFAGEAHDALDLDAPHTVFLQKPFHPNRLAKALVEVTMSRADDKSA